MFTSEGCGICRTLEPAIDNVARDPRVAVAVFDEVAEAEIWRLLAIPGSPFALALDRQGTVLAKGTFNNLAQLESVLATAERRGVRSVPSIWTGSPTRSPATARGVGFWPGSAVHWWRSPPRARSAR